MGRHQIIKFLIIVLFCGLGFFAGTAITHAQGGTVDLQFTLNGAPAASGTDYCPGAPASSVSATLENAGPATATGVVVKYIVYEPYGDNTVQTLDVGSIGAGETVSLPFDFNPPVDPSGPRPALIGGVAAVDQTDSDGLGDANFAVCGGGSGG